MFEQDYLMRIIAQLLGAIRRSMERAAGEEDPDGAASALDMALGDATDLDGEALALPGARVAGLGAAGVGGRSAPHGVYRPQSHALRSLPR